jgi:hypothetical protein
MSTAYSTNPITNTTPQTHDANGFARPGNLWRRAITMRTGHHRQPDGSVVRVDIEMGRWVGSLYTPEMEIKTRIIGSELEVHAWADRILVCRAAKDDACPPRARNAQCEDNSEVTRSG